MKNRTLASVAIGAGIVILALLATKGPSLYETQTVDMGGAGETLLQHNTLTGSTYLFDRDNGTWDGVESESSSPSEGDASTPAQLPDEAVMELEGYAGMEAGTEENDRTTFSGIIYNGSLWKITRIGIQVTAFDAEQDTVWRRVYIDDVSISAGSVGDFEFETLTGNQFDRVEWTIGGAEGIKP
jgi:hypothetical protein